LNPWIIGIGTTIILPSFVAAAKSIFLNISIWQSIVIIFNAIVLFIEKVLGFGIPVYIILICLIILILIKKILNKISDNAKPTFLVYTTDNIKAWHMKWDYYKDPYNRKYSIQNPRPVCHCDCELCSNNWSKLSCPKCGKVYSMLSANDLDEIQKIIEYNIKKGTFGLNK